MGTISADWIDYKGDESLCDRSQNRACVATFFLLKSLHSVGLGTETMDLFERTVAKDPYNVKELTLNTLSAASVSYYSLSLSPLQESCIDILTLSRQCRQNFGKILELFTLRRLE